MTAFDQLETLKSRTELPLFFERNRVFRVYQGGRLFADFFGDAPEDGNFPEEWVASSTRAMNKNPKSEMEGISVLQGTQMPFHLFLEHYRNELLGGREQFALLVKLLDSAIRLPVQAHPDKAFTRIHFNSTHGKTEMWLVLATRENACIYYGFKEGVSRDDFRQAIAASETDSRAMPQLLNRLPANPGDTYLIPARMVHAIGEGCLILEVQEPTDFVVQPEAWCGDYRLNDHEMYQGLDHELALDCFDFFEHIGPNAIEWGRKYPVPFLQTRHVTGETLIGFEDTPDFAVRRYQVHGGEYSLDNAPAIYVVTAGEGRIWKKGFSKEVKRGDYFFLPFKANGSVVSSSSNLELVECLPPAN